MYLSKLTLQVLSFISTIIRASDILKMLYTYFKNIFSAICSLRAISILRLTFGYYSDIFSSTTSRQLAIVYCLVYYFVTTASLLSSLYLDQQMIYYNIPTVLHFITAMIISIYTKDKSFLKFCDHMNIIDRMIGLKNGFNLKITNLLVFKSLLTVTVENIIWSQYLPYISFLYIIKHWAMIFVLITNHLSHTTTIVTFELFWSRIKYINQYLNSKVLNKNISNNEKIYMLKKFLHQYKLILDNFNVNNRALKVTVSLNMVNFITSIFINQYNLCYQR